MSSIAYHHNKKSGAVYAYSVKSYWDKEKKAPRNKQVCLGRVDPTTGEIVPSKRKNNIARRAVSAPGVTAGQSHLKSIKNIKQIIIVPSSFLAFSGNSRLGDFILL